MMAVDAPVPGRCVNEYRSSFGIPKNMGYPNIAPDADMGRPVDKGEGLAYEDSMDWAQVIGWVRSVTSVDVWVEIRRLSCHPAWRRRVLLSNGGIKALASEQTVAFQGDSQFGVLSHDGSKGVDLAVRLVEDELKSAMSLPGCKTIKDINNGHLAIVQNNGILSKL